MLIPINDIYPEVHESAWIADNATVTGKTVIGAHSSIWYQVVIRGDVNKIVIGEGVNIQDLTMVHGTYGKQDTIIGNRVSVGHRAIIHGCTIHDDVLIGMGAIVLDDTIIESNVIVGAGAVVTQGARLKSGFLYAGVPAKLIKPLDPDIHIPYITSTAAGYRSLKEVYRIPTS